MEAATEIFLNGIFGVFMGLAVLYGAIRLIRALAGRNPEEKEA